MAIVFTPDAVPGQIQKMGSLFCLVGTFTFSGSYATGGDATLNLETIFKRIGLGRVYFISPVRGNSAEWDSANDKLKLYASANTEVAAAAYNAALTASPVPVIIIGR
jgi:hypothetical protein